MSAPEPFAARVKRLAAERDLSVSKVGYLAYDPQVKGTNPDTFKSVMAGRRPVTTALVQAVAKVLQTAPEDFPEYRLAVARRALDEREVGLGEALVRLALIEEALLYPQAAEALERLAAEQRAATDQTRPASSCVPPNRAAG